MLLRVREAVYGTESAVAAKLRENAFARFCETGFPTTHDEDWRFTNVSVIARTRISRSAGDPGADSSSDLLPWRIDDVAAQFVFVDGQFARELSRVRSLPANVTVSGLKEEITRNAKAAGSAPRTIPEPPARSICRLEYRLCGKWSVCPRWPRRFVGRTNPFAVRVHRGCYAPHAASAKSVDFRAGEPGHSHGRIRFAGRRIVFCNTVTELAAGENSTVSHYMIEREDHDAFNISTLRIQQERSANVASHSLLLGGGLVRNNVHPVLAGEGGECLINGLFVGDGRQHLDNYMHVEHASPHCSSRQFYNGILDGKSHGVFHGRIVVHKDAQKTDAKQTNRNLLLSDDAQIDTKPQLEIYADDVKCTHGATIGQIEENALFYLQSRGVDEVSARRMLLMAFAGECLERMRSGTARNHVERLIHEHLLLVANRLPAGRKTDGGLMERNVEEVG